MTCHLLWITKPLALACVLTAGLSQYAALAQILPQIPERPLPSELLPPASGNELLPPATLPDPSEPTLDQPNARFRVDRFEVIGSTVFKPEEFAAVAAPFVGRDLSFADLLQVKSAIIKLYVDRGYITTGAVIPPQTVDRGVVKIQILEGAVAEIRVTGNRRLNANYIQDRVKLGTRAPLNVPRLLESLQLLRLNPLIENLSADLQAGIRPGENMLEVEVKEAQTFGVDVSLDNGRSPSVGSFRRGVTLSEANLLGFGDALSVSYSNTNGSNVLDLGYIVPLNARDGTLRFGFGTSKSNVIEQPFNVLDIQAKSRYYELSYRQPVLQKPTQELAFGVTFSRQESQTELGIDDIGPFPLSPGADADGKTKISALRFFQEYTQRSDRQVLAVRSQFNVGVDWLNATVNDDAPDSRFFAWRGQAQWVRLIAADTLLLLRSDVQLSNSSLVPLEQFGLGGQTSVRGYRQDALLSDSGALFSAEFRIPIVRAPKLYGVLQLIPFLDVGTAWTVKGDDPSPATLVGAGLGLLWRQGDRLSVRLDWGLPLVSVEGEQRSLQEKGLYFSVNYTPF